MELIDKAALVVEIEKRFDEYSSSILKHYDACTEARASELGKILVILNTLKVEEVDFEKYYHDFLQKEWFGRNCVRTISEMMAFTAKHFFELGISVSNKVQKGE